MAARAAPKRKVAVKAKKPVAKKKKAPARKAPPPSAPRATIVPEALPSADRSTARHAAEELSWADFDHSVQSIAREAQKKFKPQAVVGIAHGGVFVGGALASAMKAEFFPVRITRRSRDSGSRAHLGIAEKMPRELKGRRVLVVDDVAGSGDSLDLAMRMAREVGATKVLSAALVKRPDGFSPDFCARATARFIVFPWDYQDTIDESSVDPDTAGA